MTHLDPLVNESYWHIFSVLLVFLLLFVDELLLGNWKKNFWNEEEGWMKVVKGKIDFVIKEYGALM